MKKVFISHKADDFDACIVPIISKLKEHGMECWYSEHHVSPGKDWAETIEPAIQNCDYFITVITDTLLLSPGQPMNEIRLASQLGKRKIAIKMTQKPLPSGLIYHLSHNAIPWNEMTTEEAFQTLFEALNELYQRPALEQSRADQIHLKMQEMLLHTDDVFSDVLQEGGYAWGLNKSVIQNTNGGWRPDQITIESCDDTIFDFDCTPYSAEYKNYLTLRESQAILLKNQNHTKWMLTGFDAVFDRLFLSIKKTEWLQTQFVWHHLMKDKDTRKQAVTDFFQQEISSFPTSLCLHLVLIDCRNDIVASKTIRRKRNDYPGSIAVTIGEQLDETDFSSADNFMLQWLRRALIEEFRIRADEIHAYVDEDSARIMSLNLEGDIYNFSLTCCVRLKCSTQQLSEYYLLHRSFDDEFSELFPISVEEIPDILNSMDHNAQDYHPSSYLRLLFAYIYVTGELPPVMIRDKKDT